MSKLLFSITIKVNGDIFDKQEFQWIFKFLTQSYYTCIITAFHKAADVDGRSEQVIDACKLNPCTLML